MRLKFSSNTPCLGYFTHPLSRKPQKSELILQTLHLNPSHIRPLTSQLCSQSSHHTPHNAQLTSHTSHLSPPPLRFTQTHLTPRASHRTPQIKKLTANTSYLSPHSSQLTLTFHSSHLPFSPSDNTADNSLNTSNLEPDT